MKPSTRDWRRNIEVGRAIRNMVGDALAQGLPSEVIDHRVGEQIMVVAAASYARGQAEVEPSDN